MAKKRSELNREIDRVLASGGDDYIVATREEAPSDYVARAARERERADEYRRSRPAGYRALVSAHEQTAHAYEELARARGAPLPRRQVPGIAAWKTYASGSAAKPGKHSYSLYVPEGDYHVEPVSREGRHLGYSLKFAARQQPRGGHAGAWHELGTHRSPAKAAIAARKHYAASY